jgi:predicted DNA-binding protein
MGQVTIYLDDETEARLKASAKRKGVPVSRWIAELVREATAT